MGASILYKSTLTSMKSISYSQEKKIKLRQQNKKDELQNQSEKVYVVCASAS